MSNNHGPHWNENLYRLIREMQQPNWKVYSRGSGEQARQLRPVLYTEVCNMEIASFALIALIIVGLWLLVDVALFLLVWILCAIFGHNYAPAQVPNKAVWG